jgi:hypothetical protein
VGDVPRFAGLVTVSSHFDRVWVQPTVVLWGAFEQRSIQSNGVAWIDGRNLAAVLLARQHAYAGLHPRGNQRSRTLAQRHNAERPRCVSAAAGQRTPPR